MLVDLCTNMYTRGTVKEGLEWNSIRYYCIVKNFAISIKNKHFAVLIS